MQTPRVPESMQVNMEEKFTSASLDIIGKAPRNCWELRQFTSSPFQLGS